MPARKRSREATKRSGRVAQNKAGRRKPNKGSGGGRAKRRHSTLDPSAADDAQTRYIQPADAIKTYRCPGCNRDIPPGLGHLVAVPPEAPDLRRHWHRGCWNNRHRRL